MGFVPVYRKTNERIFRLALDSDWRRAKLAARYISFCKNKNDLCAELVEVCQDPPLRSASP